ncbi:hypothetical protein B7755_010245 [Streptomyces sp. NBS 14/10]|uniref:hypothetical protein n=1 Tax=Streptomyces sp. NBS 14/10 TaxID=1945643 RepID=UPI00211B1932|nr:hypothetical protein [Streptomyces sp. NBS 14/10]KAK1178479.1 hypothetical protein B7755_010245 [Streptomyces sp. NBS 14/10]
MGTLTYTDLVGANLGKLSTAVTDWKSVADGLKRLMSDARSGLLKKSEGARWAGLNATVTHEFVRKTTKEFEDLYKEASSIYAILDDAHSQLTTIQSKVKWLVARAQEDGFTVSDNSDGTVSFDESGDGGSRWSLDSPMSYSEAVNQEIRRAVTTDLLAQRALAKIHGGDPSDAGHAQYHSLLDV